MDLIGADSLGTSQRTEQTAFFGCLRSPMRHCSALESFLSKGYAMFSKFHIVARRTVPEFFVVDSGATHRDPNKSQILGDLHIRSDTFLVGIIN